MINVKFRPQRGTFEESMNELSTFAHVDELIQSFTSENRVDIDYYSFDYHTKADTFIVSIGNRVMGFMWFEETK